MPKKSFQRLLYSLFLSSVFLSIAVFLSINSLTGFVASASVEIADSCMNTVPSSVPCTPAGFCPANFYNQYILTPDGEGLCCCKPALMKPSD